jgi:hypothetical protein
MQLLVVIQRRHRNQASVYDLYALFAQSKRRFEVRGAHWHSLFATLYSSRGSFTTHEL